jgi:L-ascorbate metabolism protein UlaG (beta-lactamase superfamily)
MEIFWMNHACFKIKTESGKVIYTDPYQLPSDAEKADIIFSSHSHGDHFSRGDIKKLMKESTILIGPESISKNLAKFNGKALKFHESFEVDDIKIELVPSYTIKKSTHPQSSKWAGIIIETEGKRIYHAGDTERIPEMKDLKDITVAMLPCGGTYTMDFEESCSAAMDIKPNIVIPMHNWDKNLEDFKELMANKDPSMRVEILENKSLKI